MLAVPAADLRGGQGGPAALDREQRPALGAADRHGLLQPESALGRANALKQEDDDPLFFHGLSLAFL